MKTELGKIENVEVGFAGYQDAMFGVSFTLAGKAWGVGDFWGAFPAHDNKEKLLTAHGTVAIRLADLLTKAKVRTVASLKGVPIEATFEDNGKLKTWRVLEEVL